MRTAPVFPTVSAPVPSGPAGRPADGDCVVYVDGTRLTEDFGYVDAAVKVMEAEAAGRDAFVWVNLHAPDEAAMRRVAEIFGLHELAVADAVQADQRPKLECYGETLFMAFRAISFRDDDGGDGSADGDASALGGRIVDTGAVMIFVNRHFVITIRHGDRSRFAEARDRVDADPERVRLGGAYAVMHVVADYAIDRYLEITNSVDAQISAVQGLVFSPAAPTDVEPIYRIKNEVVKLRCAVAPLSVPFLRMQSRYKGLIPEQFWPYLNDIADQQAYAAERITRHDEMLTSLLSAALARADMQANTDMRKMSAWAGIILVPTFITSFYGMNFNMPIESWRYGYPLALIVMVLVSAAMYYKFRRKRWL